MALGSIFSATQKKFPFPLFFVLFKFILKIICVEARELAQQVKKALKPDPTESKENWFQVLFNNLQPNTD